MASRRMANPHGRKATIQGFLPDCRMVLKIPVRVCFNDSRRCRTVREETISVLAFTPTEAANYVRDLCKLRPETEIYAYGQRGGVTYRYVGHESSVWAQMMEARPKETQLRLALTEVA
jgi:hypothetical protein